MALTLSGCRSGRPWTAFAAVTEPVVVGGEYRFTRDEPRRLAVPRVIVGQRESEESGLENISDEPSRRGIIL
jgi:hypothetical protein